MNDETENNVFLDESGQAKELGEIKASIKRFHLDCGIDVSRSYHDRGKTNPVSHLTVIAVINEPEIFKGDYVSISIRGLEKEMTEITTTSLSGLPKRLQAHLYNPDYKYLGIIHWIAGAARENPPADYSTLFVKLDTDMNTFSKLSNLLISCSVNSNFNKTINVRAINLECNEFVKHEQLSVAVTGITVSVQCDS